MRLPSLTVRNATTGKINRLITVSFESGPHHRQQQEHRCEHLPQPIGQHVRYGCLDHLYIAHDVRHHLARSVLFKELRVLPQHLVENFLP